MFVNYQQAPNALSLPLSITLVLSGLTLLQVFCFHTNTPFIMGQKTEESSSSYLKHLFHEFLNELLYSKRAVFFKQTYSSFLIVLCHCQTRGRLKKYFGTWSHLWEYWDSLQEILFCHISALFSFSNLRIIYFSPFTLSTSRSFASQLSFFHSVGSLSLSFLSFSCSSF